MKKRLLAGLLLLLSSTSALGNIAVVGGANYNLDSASSSVGTTTVTASGGVGFEGGLLLTLGSLETGGLYLSRTASASAAGITVSASSSCVHIPLLYRMGGGSTTLGVGTFAEVGDGTNIGLSAGPRFGGKDGGMFVDLRFNYGLSSGNTKDALAMLGYQFGKK